MATEPVIAYRSADYVVELAAEPDGLRNVIQLHSRGTIRTEGLVAAARALRGMVDGPILNLVHDRREANSFFDFAGLSEVYTTLLDIGFRRLNIVVVDLDVARPAMLRFNTEVGMLCGLPVSAVSVGSLPLAFETLRKVLADPERQAVPPEPASRSA